MTWVWYRPEEGKVGASADRRAHGVSYGYHRYEPVEICMPKLCKWNVRAYVSELSGSSAVNPRLAYR
jgi:hypothetical protein